MPAVGHIVRDFVLKVGATAYECAMTQVTSDITQNTQEIRTACPDGVAQAADAPVEALTLAYNVSHADDSLYTYLRSHIGDVGAVEYVSSDGLAKYTGNVKIGVPTADATVGSVETGTCTLTVEGGLLTRTAVPAP